MAKKSENGIPSLEQPKLAAPLDVLKENPAVKEAQKRKATAAKRVPKDRHDIKPGQLKIRTNQSPLLFKHDIEKAMMAGHPIKLTAIGLDEVGRTIAALALLMEVRSVTYSIVIKNVRDKRSKNYSDVVVLLVIHIENKPNQSTNALNVPAGNPVIPNDGASSQSGGPVSESGNNTTEPGTLGQ